jgi:hypothetical protein
VTCFLKATRKPEITKELLGRVLNDVRAEIHTGFGSAHTTVILGVGFGLWHEMSAADGTAVPQGMALRFPVDRDEGGEAGALRSRVFSCPGTPFVDSAADLWFHIKSNDERHCEGVLAWLRPSRPRSPMESTSSASLASTGHGWIATSTRPRRTVTCTTTTRSTSIAWRR